MATSSFNKIFKVTDPDTVNMIAEELSKPPKKVWHDTTIIENELKKGRKLLKQMLSNYRKS